MFLSKLLRVHRPSRRLLCPTKPNSTTTAQHRVVLKPVVAAAPTTAAAGTASHQTSSPLPAPQSSSDHDTIVPPSSSSSSVAPATETSSEIDYTKRFSVKDHGPVRPTGLWKVDEVINKESTSIDFRKIDEIESDIMEDLANRGDALVPVADEEQWKHKLMFVHKFAKTPKHLTWKELGQEIDCIDCTFEPDPHRPEEIFTLKFSFLNRQKGTRDVIWEARNDVSISEGFTDLLAAIGSCLGRADVYRTIRFDDGQGVTRDLCFRKKSRYTSDIIISFRPVAKYNVYSRKEETDNWEDAMMKDGMSTWGFHPQLMDPEYQDAEDPEETYSLSLSAHAFSFVLLRSIDRLLARPMKDFYRPSQILRTVKVQREDDIGLSHAMKGWLGVDEQVYPHYTPIEAIQEHWLGKDAPFTVTAIVNKLREMTYLKKQNPEFQSWLAVRKRDTSIAVRNLSMKTLGVGASTLFVPVGYQSSVNRLLPKPQQRRLETRFSLNSMLGMPDETRKISEFKSITGVDRVGLAEGTASISKPAAELPTSAKEPPKQVSSGSTQNGSQAQK